MGLQQICRIYSTPLSLETSEGRSKYVIRPILTRSARKVFTCWVIILWKPLSQEIPKAENLEAFKLRLGVFRSSLFHITITVFLKNKIKNGKCTFVQQTEMLLPFRLIYLFFYLVPYHLFNSPGLSFDRRLCAWRTTPFCCLIGLLMLHVRWTWDGKTANRWF